MQNILKLSKYSFKSGFNDKLHGSILSELGKSSIAKSVIKNVSAVLISGEKKTEKIQVDNLQIICLIKLHLFFKGNFHK